jgi:hypothetical protein
MKLRKFVLRGLKWAMVSLAALEILLAVLVQGQQWLLRWRAERLMADMHQIRLYQSTWSDAQKLMHKWGAWGHYDGTCTPADCRYAITMGTSFFGIYQPGSDSPLSRASIWLVAHGYFGGRETVLQTRFLVHNGYILRTGTEFIVDVPSPMFSRDEFEYSLIVRAQSRSELHGHDGSWILGSDDQLADHPYYKAGRPGGCEICMGAVVTYATNAPVDQIERLTSFNFDCITRFHPCRFLGDAFPAEWDWNLYRVPRPGQMWKPEVPAPVRPCDIPVWALGRDFTDIIVMDVKSSMWKDDDEWRGPYTLVRGNVAAALKGGADHAPGTRIAVEPHIADTSPSWGTSEFMQPGKHYVVFFEGGDRDPRSAAIKLEPCGVQPDTPEVRAEVAKGIAMNDNLRGPERW